MADGSGGLRGPDGRDAANGRNLARRLLDRDTGHALERNGVDLRLGAGSLRERRERQSQQEVER
jgi:hypothetical protein